MIAAWGPTSSSAIRFAAYDTESVEPLIVAVGRFTFHNDVRQAARIRSAKARGCGYADGTKRTSVTAPMPITEPTYTCAGDGSAAHDRLCAGRGRAAAS